MKFKLHLFHRWITLDTNQYLGIRACTKCKRIKLINIAAKGSYTLKDSTILSKAESVKLVNEKIESLRMNTQLYKERDSFLNYNFCIDYIVLSRYERIKEIWDKLDD